MIAEVLNRSFVLEAMREALSDLEAPEERRDPPPAIQARVSADELALARAALAETLEREQAVTSGQVRSQPEGEQRRGDTGASLDDAVFISRDPSVCIFQSVLEHYLETQHADSLTSAGGDGGRRDGAAEVPPVTEVSLGLVDDDERRLLGGFEPTDIRWVNCLFAMALRRAEGKHDFNESPAPPVTVANRVRIVVVGDWGSGLPRARRVAEQMRRVLDEGVRLGVEQHVIHLGDVYYAGWDDEYRKRFLPYWPVTSDEAGSIGSWSLNGNHDMYSGGDGYFGTLLAEPRFVRHQGSSWFSLENDDWKILALDTAYDDHALRDPQPDWVRDEADGSKRTLLLSHHQLFSTDPSKGGPKLQAVLADVLSSGAVTSWFWGHEHRCVTFDPHEGVQFASCVGHGGVPMYASHDENDRPPAPGRYEYYASFRSRLERWTLMGFAVLDIDGASAAIRYIDENGKQHHDERID